MGRESIIIFRKDLICSHQALHKAKISGILRKETLRGWTSPFGWNLIIFPGLRNFSNFFWENFSIIFYLFSLSSRFFSGFFISQIIFLEFLRIFFSFIMVFDSSRIIKKIFYISPELQRFSEIRNLKPSLQHSPWFFRYVTGNPWAFLCLLLKLAL